jgi:glycosyltransferase involved in cell wall biosynthesis
MKKLNVLQFICPSGFYGAEMWILALAKNLKPDRVNCQLAITRESDGQNIELYNRFLSFRLTAHQIRMRGRFDPRGVRTLCQLIKQNSIDIIHTHGYKSDILGIIAARLTGIKAVATPHGFENAPNRKLHLFIRLGCFVLKYFDRVAPLSEAIEGDMRRFKVKLHKLRRIMNGVDLDEVEAEKSKPSSPIYPNGGEKKIGYVGQIAYRKNVGDLLNAFDNLYKKHKDVRLILVGDGPERKDLEERSRNLASAAKIEFVGFRNDRLRYLKEMDLFSMTSSLEGIPRCMMEAMAMEIPVAAYNIPGVDKLIIQEQTGLLAPFGQVDALKQCWERLLFDKEFSARVAQNGMRHVIENFSAKRMADEYTELYKEMVSGKR